MSLYISSTSATFTTSSVCIYFLPELFNPHHLSNTSIINMSVTNALLLLPILSTLGAAGPSGFGHFFGSGPTADGKWIRVANSTLVVPAPPLPQKGLLSLWVGMGTSNGDLIQTLVESYNDDIDTGCGVLDGDWCA